MTTETWFQVEYYSQLGENWVPLFGRRPSIESARVDRAKIKEGKVRIMHITRTYEEVQ